MKNSDTVLSVGHPSDWRRYLLNPNLIVPKTELSEGKGLAVAFRCPKSLVARIDAVAKRTGNTRARTIVHMLLWACDAYDASVKAEAEHEAKLAAKK